MNDNVMGIDMATARPATCLVLSSDGQYLTRFATSNIAYVVAQCAELSVDLVAIDSPLGFPRGMCCLEETCSCGAPVNGRECERLLSKRGIASYYTTKKTIIKAMIYQSMKWRDVLVSCGRDVIEIYPYATKVALFGKGMPKKSTAYGQEWLRRRVTELLHYDASAFDHDECDAALAAYTGLLYLQGESEEVGFPDESTIVLPKMEGSRG